MTFIAILVTDKTVASQSLHLAREFERPHFIVGIAVRRPLVIKAGKKYTPSFCDHPENETRRVVFNDLSLM